MIFQTNAVILEPVSFELEVARNVTGAFKPSDPADIKVSNKKLIYKSNYPPCLWDNVWNFW